MATDNEVPTARALNPHREPEGTNRMAGDTPKQVGDKAINDALTIVIICWLVVFFLPLSLRDFLK